MKKLIIALIFFFTISESVMAAHSFHNFVLKQKFGSGVNTTCEWFCKGGFSSGEEHTSYTQGVNCQYNKPWK